MKGIFTLLFLLLLACDAFSQITQTKTASAITQTAVNQPVDFTLVNAASLQEAVAATDNATANATLTRTTGSQYSEFLILSGFNFLLPPTDIDITNVSITITGSAGTANAIWVENLSLITKTGATTYNTTGSPILQQGTFPTTQGDITLGGALSNFGSPTLTPTQINNSNFGIALQLRNFTGGGGTNNVQALINQITVSVTFQPSAIAPLPVEFISLEASKAFKGVQLTWKVGTEINVDHYEVERSTDGTSFKKIGSVAASQNNSYNFTDLQPVNGIAYYRVRNVDNNGAFKYTTVVKYQNGLSTTLVKAFPTTTSGPVTVQHPSVAGKASITLSSLDGKALRSIIPIQGSVSTSIDLSAYPSGMYLLHYLGEKGYSETFRIIKQ